MCFIHMYKNKSVASYLFYTAASVENIDPNEPPELSVTITNSTLSLHNEGRFRR